MNCRSAESLFSAFLDDAMSQAERRSFESHLLGCRRCSQALREMKGALALLADVASAPDAELSPHFDEDLMARIRSGEAMRPTVVEWLQGLLAPVRLRPALMAGAAACALVVGVLYVQHPEPNGNAGPSIASTNPTAAAPSEAVPSPSEATPALVDAPPTSGTVAPELLASRPNPATAQRPRAAADPANGVIEIVDRAALGRGTVLEPALPNPNALFTDEYVTDQFYLQRGQPAGATSQPSAVPVSGQGSDDVYIEF
jgi:hypothetical protein